MIRLLSLVIVLSFSLRLSAQPIKRCGTSEYYAAKIANDPSYEASVKAAHQRAMALRNNLPTDPKSLTVTVRMIPVVVHVIYKTASQNIPLSRIQQQIDILNIDFLRLNVDAQKTRPEFLSFASRANIQFYLATIDPSGNPTNGVTYTNTTVTSFNSSTDDMKQNSTGGENAWNTAEYLNIWVCNLSGGILGITTFPGGPASYDGLVISSDYFGPVASSSPYDLGRTTTHEMGHYFGLEHPFASGNCTNNDCTIDGDYMCCTPPQSATIFACDTSSNSCHSDATGLNHPFSTDVHDQVENFMEYTDDSCMNMFCTDQTNYMQATLLTDRASLGFDTTVTVGLKVIINELESRPTISPNPGFENFTIQALHNAITHVTVYDINGRQVLDEQVVAARQFPLNLTSQPSGMYLVKIKYGNSFYTTKLIKQ